MERYLCVHGHFYQPSRQNPWLGAIDIQPEAFPYHDWNARINTECYMVNSGANILNSNGKISDLFNNYSRMSFNFGPSLLAWIKANDRDTYDCIIGADKESIKRFSGHGAAMAQIYNHIIMPLSSQRDKLLQIKWAIEDFHSNFGRHPEGIWLSETAVDMATLELLAQTGLKFTVLSPNQAHSIRKISSGESWTGVLNGRINTRMPYACRLASGNEICIFFYDDFLSNMVSFGSLLENGEAFAAKITGLAKTEQEIPEIITIASDGETYGHHHRFGEMALAYCLKNIESRDGCKLTVFGEYLEKYSPVFEVRVIENSSWSCSHGIKRWKSNCSCGTATDSQGRRSNHYWRKHLRDAITWLSNKNSSIFERLAGPFYLPYVSGQSKEKEIGDRALLLLDSYFDFINDDKGCQDAAEKYARYVAPCLAKNRKSNISSDVILKLLEAYKNSMLMQSSDGWFFDDISRIESIQILQFAARVISLLEDVSGESLEPDFLEILSRAKSNKKEEGSGRDIYLKYAKPAAFDEPKVTAMLAFEMLFEKVKIKKASSCAIYDYLAEDIQASINTSNGSKSISGTANIRYKNFTSKKAVHFKAFVEYSGRTYNMSTAKVHIDSMEKHVNGQKENPGITYSLSDFNSDFLQKIDNKASQPLVHEFLLSTVKLVDALSFEILQEKNNAIFKYLINGAAPFFKDAAVIAYLLKILNEDFEEINHAATGPVNARNTIFNTGSKTCHGDIFKQGLLKFLTAPSSVDISGESAAGQAFAATLQLENFASEFVKDTSNTGILKKMILIIEVAGKLKIQLNLWKARKIIFNATKKTGIQPFDGPDGKLLLNYLNLEQR